MFRSPLFRPFALCTMVLFLLGLSAPAEKTSPVDTLKASLADIRRFVLDNGMTCLVKEDHAAPVVAIQIWVGTGSIHEQQHLGAGLSHAMEHMVFKGTPTRPTTAITRDINRAGGTINAYTSFDRTVFHVVMPTGQWTVGLDVLADAMMNACFPEEEWQRERNVILREMAMNEDNPDRVVGKLLWRTAYTVHPYRHPVIGYEDVFKEITRADLAGFFKAHYTPDNMLTVIAGDVDPVAVEKQVRDAFAEFKRRARPPVVLPQEPPQMAARFARETGAYKISRLEMAFHTTALSHPDTPALDVLAQVVGHGRSSRLVNILKERKKLVYSIDAWSFTPKQPGVFGISASFAPEKEAEVIAAIEEQVASWTEAPFTVEEVDKAKRMALVQELAQLQTMEGQAYNLASGEFYAGDPCFATRYLDMVQKVTAETLADVARRYLTPRNRTLVILSPSEDEQAVETKTQAVAAQPEVQKLILKGGVPLIVREDHRLPFVHVCAALRGGLLSETADNNGVTRLMSNLFTRGTRNHSAEDIAGEIEKLGARLTTFSGENSFGFQAKCLSQDADKVMGLLAECLIQPTFPEEELQKQKEIQIAAIRQQEERPFFLAQQALRQTLFPGHPYRWTALGSMDVVQRLTRDQVVDHYRKHAVRRNLALAVFGDITPEEAKKLVERHLVGLRTGRSIAYRHAQPAPELPARVDRREPKEQAIFLEGYPGIDLKDPRYDALQLLGEALSGLSAELNIELREKRGLVYYSGAYNHASLEPGMFVFYAGTREDAVDELEELVEKEIARITSEGLQTEELDRVTEQMVGEHYMRLQNHDAIAQQCALFELYGLGYDHVFAFEERIRALTPERIRDAAQSILKNKQQAVALVLPKKKSPMEEQP